MRRLHYGKIHSLREAFQEGKAQDGSGKTANLGRAESRHPEAREQQCLQQKKVAELEAGITANRAATIYGFKTNRHLVGSK